MVAIEHRQKPTVSSTTSAATPSSSSSASTHEQQQQQQQEQDEQQDEQQHADVIIGMTQEQSEQQPLTTASEVRICHSKKMSKNEVESAGLAKRHEEAAAAAISKSAVSQRNVDINLASSKSSGEGASAELSKKVLTLDLTGKDTDDFSLKSPKSPISARLSHQTSLTSSVDVEDRKTLREALYQGIFHRHRRTIFAVGSFLRMLRSRNSQYNTIRSSSEGEDMEEVR